MTLIIIGPCLIGAALLVVLVAVVTNINKSAKAVDEAYEPTTPVDMSAVPEVFRNSGFSRHMKAKQKQEKMSKADKSVRKSFLNTVVALLLSGIMALVGIILLIVGILQKYPPSWW